MRSLLYGLGRKLITLDRPEVKNCEFSPEHDNDSEQKCQRSNETSYPDPNVSPTPTRTCLHFLLMFLLHVNSFSDAKALFTKVDKTIGAIGAERMNRLISHRERPADPNSHRRVDAN